MSRIAEGAHLAFLFAGHSEPGQEAIIVHIFDGSTAFARVKKWSITLSFTPTNPANYLVLSIHDPREDGNHQDVYIYDLLVFIVIL